MNAALAAGRRAAWSIVDFALPPRCPACGEIVGGDHAFCIDCWQSLTFLGDPCCRRCGLPFPFDPGEAAECAECLANPPALDRLRAAVAYGDVARKVALKLKYGRRPGVAQTLAHFMRRHVDPASAPLLAPVPLHRWRIWRRGYNQSALIASALGRAGVPVQLDLVERRRATPPLRGLGRSQRANAVGGAFYVSQRHRTLISGRTILLVDDVYTTGATGNACAKALKHAGAARVELICWARVVREQSD